MLVSGPIPAIVAADDTLGPVWALPKRRARVLRLTVAAVIGLALGAMLPGGLRDGVVLLLLALIAGLASLWSP